MRIDPLQERVEDLEFDVVYRVASQEVHRVLPAARLVLASLYSTCRDLPALQGRLSLTFMQRTRRLVEERIEGANVDFNTRTQQLEIAYRDWTGHAVHTEGPPFPRHEQFRRTASLVSEHLRNRGIQECNVSFFKDDSERWFGSCWEPEALRRCEFVVVGGEVQPRAGGSRGP